MLLAALSKSREQFQDLTLTVGQLGERVLRSHCRGWLGEVAQDACGYARPEDPAPEATATLRIAGLDDARAVEALSSALTSPFDVTGAAHWPGRGTFVRVEGFAPSVAYRAGELQRRLGAFGAVEVVGDDPWPAIRDVVPFHGVQGDVWRLSTLPSDAAALVARSGAGQALYDWGGGLVWLLTDPGHDLRAALGNFAGHATLIRSDSGLPVFHPEPAPVAALTKGLRAKFDPRGLFVGA